MSNLVARIGAQPFVLVESLVILCMQFIDQVSIDSPTVNVEVKSARKSNDFLVLKTGIGGGFLSTKTLILFTTYLFANLCRRVSTKHAGERVCSCAIFTMWHLFQNILRAKYLFERL
jgi:hypothetical protein